jgi:hypothetical protein
MALRLSGLLNRLLIYEGLSPELFPALVSKDTGFEETSKL